MAKSAHLEDDKQFLRRTTNILCARDVEVYLYGVSGVYELFIRPFYPIYFPRPLLNVGNSQVIYRIEEQNITSARFV